MKELSDMIQISPIMIVFVIMAAIATVYMIASLSPLMSGKAILKSVSEEMSSLGVIGGSIAGAFGFGGGG